MEKNLSDFTNQYQVLKTLRFGLTPQGRTLEHIEREGILKKDEKGIDCILSPVANKNGDFFDSRTADTTYPQDADANGAYHIALKGLMLLDKINQAQHVSKLTFKDMAISNKEWIKFTQERCEG